MKIFIEKYKTILIGGAVIVIASLLFLNPPEDDEQAGMSTHEFLSLSEEEAPAEPDRVEEAAVLYVDVKGAVHLPGVYTVKEQDRVFDILQQAGGITDQADESKINYAQKVHDEMVLYVPEIGEEIPVHIQVVNITDQSTGTGKLNINTAQSEEFETLPGIGPAKAKAIVDFRNKNGSFQQVEDLKKVTGIGQKSFEKLEELITVK